MSVGVGARTSRAWVGLRASLTREVGHLPRYEHPGSARAVTRTRVCAAILDRWPPITVMLARFPVSGLVRVRGASVAGGGGWGPLIVGVTASGAALGRGHSRGRGHREGSEGVRVLCHVGDIGCGRPAHVLLGDDRAGVGSAPGGGRALRRPAPLDGQRHRASASQPLRSEPLAAASASAVSPERRSYAARAWTMSSRWSSAHSTRLVIVVDSVRPMGVKE